MEQKSELQFEEKIFVGKELASKGTDKKGVDWKRFKTAWKDKMSDQYSKNRFMFEREGMKGLKPSELEEGEAYSYGYTDFNGVFTDDKGEQKSYTSKTIQICNKPKHKDQRELNNNPDTSLPEELNEWVAKLKENKDDFARNFCSSDGVSKFIEWMDNPQACETNYLVSKGWSDEVKRVEAKKLYNILMAKFDEVI